MVELVLVVIAIAAFHVYSSNQHKIKLASSEEERKKFEDKLNKYLIEHAAVDEKINNQKENIEKLDKDIVELKKQLLNNQKQLEEKIQELFILKTNAKNDIDTIKELKANISSLEQDKKVWEKEGLRLEKELSNLEGIKEQQTIESKSNIAGDIFEEKVYELISTFLLTYEKVDIKKHPRIEHDAQNTISNDDIVKKIPDFLLSFSNTPNVFKTKNINFKLVIECKNTKDINKKHYKQLIEYCRMEKASYGILLSSMRDVPFERKENWEEFGITKNSNDATIFLVSRHNLPVLLFFLVTTNEEFKRQDLELTASEKNKNIHTFMNKYQDFFNFQEKIVNKLQEEVKKIKDNTKKIFDTAMKIDKSCAESNNYLEKSGREINQSQMEFNEMPKLLENNLATEQETKAIAPSTIKEIKE